jgi:hypothetical protein
MELESRHLAPSAQVAFPAATEILSPIPLLGFAYVCQAGAALPGPVGNALGSNLAPSLWLPYQILPATRFPAVKVVANIVQTMTLVTHGFQTVVGATVSAITWAAHAAAHLALMAGAQVATASHAFLAPWRSPRAEYLALANRISLGLVATVVVRPGRTSVWISPDVAHAPPL